MNKWLSLTSIIIFSLWAQTASAQVSQTWSGYLIGGIGVDMKTDDTDPARPGPFGGIEFVLSPVESVAEVAFVGEWLEYAYKSGKTPDSHFSGYVVPRLHTGRGVNLWAGLGLGVVSTSVGDKVQTSGDITRTFDDKNTWTFSFSPRLGLDFSLGEDFLLGIQAAYYHYPLEFDGDTVNNETGEKGTFNESLRRTFWTYGLRLGFRF